MTRPTEPSGADVRAFYHALGTGRDQAQTAAELAQRLGFTGSAENAKRRVRLLAEYAVEAGLLVIGDNDGYYTPATAAECDGMFARFQSQIARMAQRLTRAKGLRDQQFGEQRTLW